MVPEVNGAASPQSPWPPILARTPRIVEDQPITVSAPKTPKPQPNALGSGPNLAPPKFHAKVERPAGIPPPYPVSALALQRLLDIQDREATPKRSQNAFSAREIPHFPNSTAKAANPISDTEFMKKAIISSSSKHAVVRPTIPQESCNGALKFGAFPQSNLTCVETRRRGEAPY